MLRVKAICDNKEFDHLDEYVLSIRNHERLEYFEEVRFKIRKGQQIQVKVAIKIPPVQTDFNIEGHLLVQLENLLPMRLPI